MSLTAIREEIVRLSTTKCALDEERTRKIEASWAVESEERIDAVDRSELQTIDVPTALQELRSALSK